jgi:peptidylprolyl isomerase
MKVENGKNVSVHYRGTLSDGSEFDNSKTRGETLSFQVGSGMMIPGFDTALLGMSAGETKNVTLSAGDAYGDRVVDAVQTVPKSAFGEGFEFLVGEVIQGNGPRGPFMAKIQEEREEDVLLDFNHPLAGEELSFEIELVSVSDKASTS